MTTVPGVSSENRDSFVEEQRPHRSKRWQQTTTKYTGMVLQSRIDTSQSTVNVFHFLLCAIIYGCAPRSNISEISLKAETT